MSNLLPLSGAGVVVAASKNLDGTASVMSEKVTVCACTTTTVLQARTVIPATHAIQERNCILPPLLSSRCHQSAFSQACRGPVRARQRPDRHTTTPSGHMLRSRLKMQPSADVLAEVFKPASHEERKR